MDHLTNTTLTETTDVSSISPWLILTVVGAVLIALKAMLSLIIQLVIIFVLTAVGFYLVESWKGPSTFADCLRKLTFACTTSLNVISNGKFNNTTTHLDHESRNFDMGGDRMINNDDGCGNTIILDYEGWTCIGLRVAQNNVLLPVWKHVESCVIFDSRSLFDLPHF